MSQIFNTVSPPKMLTQKPVSEETMPIAPYILGQEIGRGGMSIVYAARETRTGQEVALKLLTLPDSLTPEEARILIARFEREARTIARLSHPNIVGIYEIGIQEGRHFLAMEYLRGQTLREQRMQESLTPGEVYFILTQIAGALDAVHEAGIVHRDIKPSNIMLLPDGTAKLLDFGIARPQDETTLTSAGDIVGSPSYMAPEQVKGEPGTAATDLWALGVLAYEMLAGHPPFNGQSVANLLYQVTNESPARTPGLPIAVQKVLRRALDKRPERRYPTARAFVQALRETQPGYAATLPSIEPRPTTLFRSPRWLPGTALLILFFLGFSWSILTRHPAAASLPVTKVSRSLEFRHVSQIPPPVVQFMPRSGALVFALPKVRVRSHKTRLISSTVRVLSAGHGTTCAKSEIVLRPRPYSAPQSKPPLAYPSRLTEVMASQPVQPRRAAITSRPGPLDAAPVTTSLPSISAPAASDGDDPEAEARLRKFVWAQHE